jgi:hypothetical protein
MAALSEWLQTITLPFQKLNGLLSFCPNGSKPFDYQSGNQMSSVIFSGNRTVPVFGCTVLEWSLNLDMKLVPRRVKI